MLFSLFLMAAPLAPVPVALDQTPQLKAIQQQVRAGDAGPLPIEARVTRFLFVPGFSWDALPNYFEPNIRRMRDLGLDAQMVPVDPLGTPEANGRAVAAAVKADPRPAVIIAHSKGGLDAIAGLKADEKARAQVPKLVAIQTPYAGAGVADWVHRRRLLRAAALVLFRGRTMRDISRAGRAAQAALAPFPDGGPEVYSISSRVTDDTRVHLLLWLTAGTVKQVTGFDNDGIVSHEEADIPDAVRARLEHVGHIDTVSEPSGWKHKTLGVRGHDPSFAADLTEAIVRWIFAKRPSAS